MNYIINFQSGLSKTPRTTKKKKCSHGNDIENKTVFSFRQNDVSDTQSVMSSGLQQQQLKRVLTGQTID